MKIKDLAPNPKNPRTISPEKLKSLKQSLVKYGDMSGFVYNKQTKRLVGGHQRSKVLPEDAEIKIEKQYSTPTACNTVAEGYILVGGERFKYREVEADEKWETEALIAANKHGGEWNDQGLQDLIRSIPELNLELVGFSIPEIQAMNLEVKPIDIKEFTDNEKENQENKEKKKEKEEEIPEVTKGEPKSKLNELWLLGEHRLLIGDCTVKENVDRLMNGEKADMVYTDPPYGVNERTDRKSKGRGKLAECNDFSPVHGDDKPFQPSIILGFECPKIIWGANYFSERLPASSSWIIWDKRDGINSNDNADCELAWSDIGGPARIFRHLWNGMIKASEQREKRVHPTQKPVALAEWCISKTQYTNIVDLFLGSGSTLIACEQTKRRCFGMEISPQYADVILTRFAKLTGKDPVREDGVKWSSLI